MSKTFEQWYDTVDPETTGDDWASDYDIAEQAWKAAQEQAAKRILDAFDEMDMEVGVGAGYRDWFNEMYREFLSK